MFSHASSTGGRAAYIVFKLIPFDQASLLPNRTIALALDLVLMCFNALVSLLH
jgi:hypothetical protein